MKLFRNTVSDLLWGVLIELMKLQEFGGIRFARMEDIIAMKFEIIGLNGRKKDFWDIHELMEHFSMTEMLDLYRRRYPYNYSREEIIKKLTDFKEAESDPDPNCLKNKHWELIKLDIEESVALNFQRD